MKYGIMIIKTYQVYARSSHSHTQKVLRNQNHQIAGAPRYGMFTPEGIEGE
jgi:hypothetical protein